MIKDMSKILSTYGLSITSNETINIDNIIDAAKKLGVSLFIIGSEKNRKLWENKAMDKKIPRVFITYQILTGRKNKQPTHPYLTKDNVILVKKNGKEVNKVVYNLTENFWEILDLGCLLVLDDCKILKAQTTASFNTVTYLIGVFLDLFNKRNNPYDTYVVMTHNEQFFRKLEKENIKGRDLISYMIAMGICRYEEFPKVKKKYMREFKSIEDSARIFNPEETRKIIKEVEISKDREVIIEACKLLYIRVIYPKLYSGFV